MSTYYLLPLFSGFVYALGSFLSKRALQEGAGIMRFAFISNWVMLFTFSLPLLWQDRQADWSEVHWPMLAGAFFFVGQVLTFTAIRLGDVSIQTPLMGTKVLFVTVLSILLGTQQVGVDLWIASLITVVAVALLGYTGGFHRNNVFVAMTSALGSALFFALADVTLARGAESFGPAPFLSVMMVVNAGLSLTLVPFFREGLTSIPSGAWRWTVAGAILIGIQSMVLGFFFANYRLVAEGNILYSSRGIWSVVLGILLATHLGLHSEVMSRKVIVQRLSGALLMSAAIWIVLR